MKKILVAGAGGAPSEGVINSLLKSGNNFEVIGMGSEVTDLVLSNAKRKYYVPYANTLGYKEALLKVLQEEKPDLVHFQNDLEIYHASLLRTSILDLGVNIFMPPHDVIDTCVHKYQSYVKFKDAGIKVPRNMMIRCEDDLVSAFKYLGDASGSIWLRAASIGGGGKGSIPTNSFEMARAWIDRYNGWGDFIAAEMLTSETVTWLSIWYHGELIVAQTRKRTGWVHGNRSISGVTGVTKVGTTMSDETVTKVAIDAIKSITVKPHGIFGVDMTYDKENIPNPTEINISRFFTTILFFTEAGLNMPEIFANLALFAKKPILSKKINPLENDLCWLRGMDTSPKLVRKSSIDKEIIIL